MAIGGEYHWLDRYIHLPRSNFIVCASRTSYTESQVSEETASFSQSGSSLFQGHCGPNTQYLLGKLDRLARTNGCLFLSPQSAFHSRLGGTENAHFLEKFRYIIVASQLLSDIQNPSAYNRQTFPPPVTRTAWESSEEQDTKVTWSGLLLTIATAFALTWSIRWLHNTTWAGSNRGRLSLVTAVIALVVVVLYVYLRRQRLANLRMQAVEGASSLTSIAQSFDAVASAALTLIQEVELISRGYRM